MRRITISILFLGAMALAGPASAQLVNGLPGVNYNHEAPIGTKGGGSPSSLKAPGEAAAIAGALRNEREANTMRLRPRTVALRTKSPALRRQALARNEFLEARARLAKGSE